MEEPENLNVPAITPDGDLAKDVGRTDTAYKFNPSNLDDLDNILAKLKKAKKGISLDRAIYEFNEIGDESRGIFLGFGGVRFKDDKGVLKQTQPAVCWLDFNKQILMCAGVALVSVITEALQAGTLRQGDLIAIALKEKQKNGAKTLKLYNVNKLEI